jgi:hypothetical protein
VTGAEDCDALALVHTEQEDRMNLASHLQELKRKHTALSTAVEEAQRAPGVDDLHIASLKKQKLKLKEEIARLSETRH